MSAPSRAAARALLPLLRSGLSRRGGGEAAARRCYGTSSVPLSSRRALGGTCRLASGGLGVARRNLGAGGLRWYSSGDETDSRSGDESGESVASSVTSVGGGVPEFAFAFDIDGVLLHSSEPIPGATETLKYLQQHRIPFILLTNGGGKTETARVADLSEKFGVELDVSNFVQSHTPYQRLLDPTVDLGYPGLENYLVESLGRPRLTSEDTVLVLGSDASKARHIAEGYGFGTVVTPGDILRANPELFPFDPLAEFYGKQEIRPLPRPVYDPKAVPAMRLEDCLKIDAILVFNDPRDWAADVQLVTDLLLSRGGYLGTYSARNGDPTPSRKLQWQGDGQPALVFSNADLLWSTGYHLSRLGQGAFAAALQRVWGAMVISAGGQYPQLRKFSYGKPREPTYVFACDVLEGYYKSLHCGGGGGALHKVHMVGDNPESDIRGVRAWNNWLRHRSAADREARPMPEWTSYLVRTGVWAEDRMPLERLDKKSRPHDVTDDVRAAVNLALEREGWAGRVE